MTFAVLPFEAPSGDAAGARLAREVFERIETAQSTSALWARVVPRALVEQQMARPQSLSALGAALDVHFLLRGTVTRSDTGYTLVLAVLDAATEQMLHQRTVQVGTPEGVLTAATRALKRTAGELTYAALK